MIDLFLNLFFLLGRNSTFPLCPPRLLWHCQTSPPPWCQPWATWLERTSAHRCGQRGHASPGPGTPTGPPNSERACSCRLSQWYVVGGAWSDVLAVGWISRPTWKKCLLLWDHRTQRYDPTTTKVSLHSFLKFVNLMWPNLITFSYRQQLVDEWSAVPFPSELEATTQPISNSTGPTKSHGPLPSANQHLAGGDFRRRGSWQTSGRPQSYHPSLPVTSASPSAAFLFLYPTCIAATLQWPPARAQLYYCDRQNSQRAHRKSGCFTSHRTRLPIGSPTSWK